MHGAITDMERQDDGMPTGACVQVRDEHGIGGPWRVILQGRGWDLARPATGLDPTQAEQLASVMESLNSPCWIITGLRRAVAIAGKGND